LPKRWLRERERDPYHRLAKKEGYRSRAAYKLLQTANKHRLLRGGDVVVDLGAAPGGWTQATRTVVGEKGYVLAVDIKPMQPFGFPNVKTMIADISDPKILDRIMKSLPRSPDAVLSDASPNLSGVWEVDHARQIDLATASLAVAIKSLRLGGNFFVKVFHGNLLKSFVDEVKKNFKSVKIVKPMASRSKSSEVYILGISFRHSRAS
jgi:23S rRNA (uridine2552-2'-O)-methyltransferase